MSVLQYIACEKCKECIWIGQMGLGGWTFYRGHPNCMRALGNFLGEHMFHSQSIKFFDEHHIDREDDYKEIEWKDDESIQPEQERE